MGCAISGVFAVVICCSRNVWAKMFTKDAAVVAAFAGIAIPLGLALLGESPLCKLKLSRCTAQLIPGKAADVCTALQATALSPWFLACFEAAAGSGWEPLLI